MNMRAKTRSFPTGAGALDASLLPLRFSRLVLVAAFLLVAKSSAVQVDTRPASAAPSLQTTTSTGRLLAIADLDGDGRADLVSAGLSGWSSDGAFAIVRVQLTSGAEESLTLPLPLSSLRVFPRDVDQDLNLDLVVTGGWMNRLVGVWINDSHGGFTANTPSSFEAEFGHASTTLLAFMSGNSGSIGLALLSNSLALDEPQRALTFTSASTMPGWSFSFDRGLALASEKTRAPPFIPSRSS